MKVLLKFGFWAWYLDDSSTPTRADVVRSWECRRWAFNICVGCASVFTWLAVMIAGSAAVKPGVDFEEPLAMIFGPPIDALIANICYGVVGLRGLFFTGKPRHRLLQFGFWFSIAVTALPGLWAIYCCIRAVATGKLMD